jgi:hypothetical protein
MSVLAFPIFSLLIISLASPNMCFYFDDNLSSLVFEIQGDFESCADILITSYWLHVELGKNV